MSRLVLMVTANWRPCRNSPDGYTSDKYELHSYGLCHSGRVTKIEHKPELGCCEVETSVGTKFTIYNLNTVKYLEEERKS